MGSLKRTSGGESGIHTSSSFGDVVLALQRQSEVTLMISLREEPYERYATETFLLNLTKNQFMAFSEYL